MTARLPITCGEWRKNAREVVRVRLDEFQGRATIDVRCWWHGDDGELKPGRNGFTIAVRHLPQLVQAVDEALAKALALGLLRD